jgi:hypothetical protein
VIVVVTDPAITIRAGTSHLGGAEALGTGPVLEGQHRSINPIPPNATSAPTTGASTRTWNTIPNST